MAKLESVNIVLGHLLVGLGGIVSVSLPERKVKSVAMHVESVLIIGPLTSRGQA